MRFIRKMFIAGLTVVVPVGVTAYLVFWLATSAEATLGRGLQWLLPEVAYFPGLGVLCGIALVLLVGILTRTWIIRWFWRVSEEILASLPLVKTIYNPLRDMMSFFTRDKHQQLSHVVMVELQSPPCHILGFMTRDSVAELKREDGSAIGEDLIAVYLPMSYQIGGYTAIIPRSRVTPLSMGVEEAMRFAITAGMASKDGDT